MQTIPLGLFTIRNTGFSFSPTGFPSQTTFCPGRICIPITAISPSTRTFPSSTSLSASLLEQTPASLRYLFKRIVPSKLLLPFIHNLFSKIYPFAHYIVSVGRMQEKTPVSPGPFPDLADVFLSHCPGISGHQKMHLIRIEPLIYNLQPPINAVFLDHWC